MQQQIQSRTPFESLQRCCLTTKFEIRGAVLLVIEKVRPVVFAVVLNSCYLSQGWTPNFILNRNKSTRAKPKTTHNFAHPGQSKAKPTHGKASWL